MKRSAFPIWFYGPWCLYLVCFWHQMATFNWSVVFPSSKLPLPSAVRNPESNSRLFAHVLFSFTIQLWFLHPVLLTSQCPLSLTAVRLCSLSLCLLPHRLPLANLSVSPICQSPNPFFLAPSLIGLTALPYPPLTWIVVFTPDNPKSPPFLVYRLTWKKNIFFFGVSCTQF